MIRNIVVACVILFFSAEAFACPNGQSEACIPMIPRNICGCVPNAGGDLARAVESARKAVEHAKKEAQAQAAGHALAVWIQGSRNSAIATAQPIPEQIRAKLVGHVEDDLLKRVRFKIGDSGILNLSQLTLAYGDKLTGRQVDAVTLIDVVVFRSEEDALRNVGLWAHELWHVKQFRDWGVRDFAIRYARNYNSVEDPAYNFGSKVNASLSKPVAPIEPTRSPPIRLRVTGWVEDATGTRSDIDFHPNYYNFQISSVGGIRDFELRVEQIVNNQVCAAGLIRWGALNFPANTTMDETPEFRQIFQGGAQVGGGGDVIQLFIDPQKCTGTETGRPPPLSQ